MEQNATTTKRVNVTKWRLLWILIAAAWLFVFLKLIIGAVFEKNTSLVAAFSVTNPQEISAMVEVTANCPGEVLSKKECENLMEEVADSIGLKLDTEPEWTENEQRKELRFYKDALAADTELKVISLYMKNDKSEESNSTINTKHYLYAKISLNESLDTVLAYKTLLEKKSCKKNI